MDKQVQPKGSNEYKNKSENGILKDEFYFDQTFDNVARARRATKSVINLYNQIRLHVSLDYKTPNMVYLKTA
tara:strand:- start:1 stop:216 length:216 start_codon:yes stop_codon:yes gene_type:complete